MVDGSFGDDTLAGLGNRQSRGGLLSRRLDSRIIFLAGVCSLLAGIVLCGVLLTSGSELAAGYMLLGLGLGGLYPADGLAQSGDLSLLRRQARASRSDWYCFVSPGIWGSWPAN